MGEKRRGITPDAALKNGQACQGCECRHGYDVAPDAVLYKRAHSDGRSQKS